MHPGPSHHSPAWLHWAFISGVVLLLVQRIAHSNPDPDLFGYLSFGREFWTTGFPFVDSFAYSEKLPQWIYHEWLTGVFLFPLWDTNPALVQLAKIVLISLTIGVAYNRYRAHSHARLTYFCVIVLLLTPFFSYGYSPLRAQAFTNFLFLLTLYYYFEDRAPFKFFKIIGATVLFSIWANMHGGFMVGMMMGGVGILYRLLVHSTPVRRASLLLVPFTGILINPYGLDYLAYIYDALSLQRVEIYEWHSVFRAFNTGHSYDVLLHFIVVALATALILLLARPKGSSCYIILGITFIAGCKHLRHQAFFYLSVLYFIPALLPDACAKFLTIIPKRSFLPRLVVVLAMLCSAFFFYIHVTDPPYQKLMTLEASATQDLTGARNPYPVNAIAYLRQENATGNIVSEFHWGQYVMWSLHPQLHVGFDGRYETVYTQRTSELFFEFINKRSQWQAFLDAFPPDFILIEPDTVLAGTLRNSSQWRVIFEDEVSVLFGVSRSHETN